MELIDKSKGGRGCHCVFFLLSEKSLSAKWLIVERIKKKITGQQRKILNTIWDKALIYISFTFSVGEYDFKML